jgi:cation diffusion facilitator family transporter
MQSMSAGHHHASDLTKWAWLSIATALVTMGMKYGAYALTGSVGLLSDAIETLVNLVAAIVALVALRLAARPADDKHPFGHGKAEYMSAGAEGVMIVVAAVLIAITAIERLINPEPIDSVGIGLLVTGLATVLNLVVGMLIVRAGKRERSITLVADGKHLLTDVWTSVGVIVGVALVAVTHWAPLDSIVALAVAINILQVGYGLVRHAFDGLLDRALPDEDRHVVQRILEAVAAEHPDGMVAFHDLQTREAGRMRFIRMHVLVPGSWTVAQGHELVEDLETRIATALPGAIVDTHLEPIEDPRAYGHGRPAGIRDVSDPHAH